MRRRMLGIIAALLAFPASADAETYCVGNPPNCDGVSAAGLQVALTAAASSAEDDRIHIGAGTFNGPFVYMPALANAGSLSVHGTGEDSTILQATSAGATVLNLLAYDETEPRTSTGLLGVRIPDGGIGVNTYGSLESIHATAQPGAGDVTGFRVNGSSIARLLSAELPGSGTALRAETAAGDLSGEASVLALTAAAGRGLDLRNDAWVGASRITSSDTGISGCSASVDVFSSILVATAGRGVAAQSGCAEASSIVRVRATTIVGEGASGTGLVAGDSARLELDSSIVRRFPHAYRTQGGTVAAQYSLVDLAAAEPASTTPAEDRGGNVDGDPRFADATARDFRVDWASPVIDAGNPKPFPRDPGTIDYFMLDGDGDGVGRRDIGAHEFAGAIPRVTAPATALTGELVTFDGSASSAVNGPVTHLWTFEDGATSTVPVVKRGFAKPGAHRVTLTVTDRSGDHVASRTVTVLVSAPAGASPDPPGSAAPSAGPDTLAPVLADLRARRGRLRWTVSEDATLTVALRRCAKVRGRRCARWGKARVITRMVSTGPGTLALPRRQMRRGRWRARVSARDAAGNRSPTRTVTFTR